MNEQTTLPARTQSEAPLPAMFGRLRDEIDHLFDDFSFARPARSFFSLPAAMRFTPAMDIHDRGNRYDVALELPGMEEKDIDVEVADGVLTVSGEKRSDREEKTDGCLVSERSYGSFRRQFTLPRDVDPDAIEAKYKSGVLHLKLGKDKAAQSRTRKIAVGT
ncbi:molecular chaperone Hsp20 [Tsuneonella deserti]|uniref:Molecular chaperone Hsp20 n=1 Tax=Tsuneonella deserti TaxID=2035528 RepID=A0ABQ1S1N1_9SPHN|nr:Hsp20/alpha crystallin family protein [Tsuneonella deserti]GGD86376.1 molecular chaperone Hsp20 [Tsuneonella deserti]